MKENAAIIIEGLSKLYHRGKVRKSDLKGSLTSWMSPAGVGTEVFFALDDIDLTIEQGDIVGIVGPNGAGKSTLLKILSRITFPTKGKITIHGSLASMLEVGTGFHPELTGRENIYLNGAIIGMRREEVSRNLDSIVSFSGLEAFLDTPVKQYSSGMYVRLAFSVSAHLNTDILLLDEVLGVGDLEFKKKSLQKITEKLNEGRTIIMVSHHLDVLRSLCINGIYLDRGKVISTGTIHDVIEKYLFERRDMKSMDLSLRTDRQGNGKVIITSIRFVNKDGIQMPELHSGQLVKILVQLDSKEKIIEKVDIRLDVFDKMGQQWFSLSNTISDGAFLQCSGVSVLECEVPNLPLGEGHYMVNANLHVNNQLCDSIKQAAEIEIVHGDFYQTGRLPPASHGVLIPYHWRLKDK